MQLLIFCTVWRGRGEKTASHQARKTPKHLNKLFVISCKFNTLTSCKLYIQLHVHSFSHCSQSKSTTHVTMSMLWHNLWWPLSDFWLCTSVHYHNVGIGWKPDLTIQYYHLAIYVTYHINQFLHMFKKCPLWPPCLTTSPSVLALASKGGGVGKPRFFRSFKSSIPVKVGFCLNDKIGIFQIWSNSNLGDSIGCVVLLL